MVRMRMPVAFAVALLMVLVTPTFGRPEPSVSSSAAAASSDARWAEWEAQSRITDGDYDGAIQAEQQAQADRRQAERRRLPDRSPNADDPDAVGPMWMQRP